MDKAKAIAEIREFLTKNSDPKIVEKNSRYFKEGFQGYGIAQEVFEKQRDIWLEKWKDNERKWFAELGTELVKSGKYEEGALAILFLRPFKDKFPRETLELFGKWLEVGFANWAPVDYQSSEIVGPMLKDNKIPLGDIGSWRQSESKWKRRAVPVSMIKLLKTTDNYAPLLKFIEPMMRDNERVVHQGLGWFLREMWKKNPAPVEAFLFEWKNISARLIFQYACEKMTKEQKERFKKEKG
jgi:3-methyladenine DNA glycosylase AlkD